MTKDRLLKLSTPAGFRAVYFEYIAKTGTCQAAYEAAEREYKKYYGQNRYTSYLSFRNTLCRSRKSKK